MKAAVRIAWCLAILLVVHYTPSHVKGQNTLSCATINLRMISCYIHVLTCHANCKEKPCNDQCTPPPVSCCVNLGRIAKGINTDADAKGLCDCLQETVIDKTGSPFTGPGLSVLPKECMLAMKIPTITPDTKCRKYVEEEDDCASRCLAFNNGKASDEIAIHRYIVYL
ncbi:hypothetical protein LXL04_026652 [Taraxacum kok-saghyz]